MLYIILSRKCDFAQLLYSLDKLEHNEIIGRLLRQIRTEKNLQQLDVAARMGISQPNIADYEKGKYTPTLEWVRRFCVAVEASPREFYNRLCAEYERNV